MYVFHMPLVLALIHFGFAALVCKNSETDDRHKYRCRKQRRREYIARLGNDRYRRRRCRGRAARRRLRRIARGILMRCFLGDACILHNDSLKLTGGQHGKGNAFRKLIAIGGGDLRQCIVTGRQLFNIVGLVLGNPLCNRVAVLILDDQLRAGQLFTCGNVNLETCTLVISSRMITVASSSSSHSSQGMIQSFFLSFR